MSAGSNYTINDCFLAWREMILGREGWEHFVFYSLKLMAIIPPANLPSLPLDHPLLHCGGADIFHFEKRGLMRLYD